MVDDTPAASADVRGLTPAEEPRFGDRWELGHGVGELWAGRLWPAPARSARAAALPGPKRGAKPRRIGRESVLTSRRRLATEFRGGERRQRQLRRRTHSRAALRVSNLARKRPPAGAAATPSPRLPPGRRRRPRRAHGARVCVVRPRKRREEATRVHRLGTSPSIARRRANLGGEAAPSSPRSAGTTTKMGPLPDGAGPITLVRPRCGRARRARRAAEPSARRAGPPRWPRVIGVEDVAVEVADRDV